MSSSSKKSSTGSGGEKGGGGISSGKEKEKSCKKTLRLNLPTSKQRQEKDSKAPPKPPSASSPKRQQSSPQSSSAGTPPPPGGKPPKPPKPSPPLSSSKPSSLKSSPSNKRAASPNPSSSKGRTSPVISISRPRSTSPSPGLSGGGQKGPKGSKTLSGAKRSLSPTPGSAPTSSSTPPVTKSSSSSAPAGSPPKDKKRRFAPQPIPPHLATTSSLRLIHQRILLSFVLTRNSQKNVNGPSHSSLSGLPAQPPEYTWSANGVATLYILDEGPITASPISATTQTQSIINRLAFHCRNIKKIDKITVETLQLNSKDKEKDKDGKDSNAGAKTLSSNMEEQRLLSYSYFDPLEHVLIKPAISYTTSDLSSNSNKNKGLTTSMDTDAMDEYEEVPLQLLLNKFDADTQSSRGGPGMTTALRAASMASNMGELRMTIQQTKKVKSANQQQQSTPQKDAQKISTSAISPQKDSSPMKLSVMDLAMLADGWRRDLNQLNPTNKNSSNKDNANSPQIEKKEKEEDKDKAKQEPSKTNNDNTTTTTEAQANKYYGTMAEDNRSQLNQRVMARRKARINLISKKLAQAYNPIKVTIHYSLDITANKNNMGGLHIPRGEKLNANASNSSGSASSYYNSNASLLPPHMYTTCGTFGDHEGPRCWVPCLDSASHRHRASYEMTVQVTAPMKDGLSTFGFGEDIGIGQTLLHMKDQLRQLQLNQNNSVKKEDATTERMDIDNDSHDDSDSSNQQNEDKNTLIQKLGQRHVQLLKESMEINNQKACSTSVSSNNNNNNNIGSNATPQPHIIPPDEDQSSLNITKENNINSNKEIIPMDAILATHVYSTSSWLPMSARSLGFAIGPWKVVEDSEYFEEEEIIISDDMKKQAKANEDRYRGDSSKSNKKKSKMDILLEKKQKEKHRIESARRHGLGIRQVYFAPIHERRNIHAPRNHHYYMYNTENAIHAANCISTSIDSTSLLPNVSIPYIPLSNDHQRISQQFNDTVVKATVGVPHRALSLMKDILALPSYRTSSYTQIWIPNAVHGGYTCGALHTCPEVLCNPFLGGSIIDSSLMPCIGYKLPYYLGGRVLQFTQARNCIRGWIMSSLPLGGYDDVGYGYIFTLIESFLMSLYERGYGAQGEGGAKGGMFFTKRYAQESGVNNIGLDFLPVRNIEADSDFTVGGIMGAVPVEDRNNDLLWRSATNGTESHTSSMDEFSVRQVLCKDAVDVLERGTDKKDETVPNPSMGWLGSHLALSFLSSNASSSSDLGCGALELVHSVGGLPYRTLKGDLFRRVVEGRAGVANFIRLVRAAFIAASLDDLGEKELQLPSKTDSTNKKDKDKDGKGNKDKDKSKTATGSNAEPPLEPPKPPFIVCVNELLKKKGLTHTLFTRALQNLAGRIREGHLLGTLVDLERDSEDPRTRKPFIEPEGFPNSYVRGSSSLYLRVGTHVEAASREGGTSQSQSAALAAKGIQLQAYAEPVIPEGGVAFSGPITVRVIENEGQFREYVKDITADGSRRDWGSTFLHAKCVTLPKDQTAASGTLETTAATTVLPSVKDSGKGGVTSQQQARGGVGGEIGAAGVFAGTLLQEGSGYQAIELARLTNLTPLLWVRVDPMGLYAGRISVFQPDACLAEQLFHDGDAGAQVDAMRCLAERPLRIQGSVKVTSVYDVRVAEIPVRLLGDCLRGSPALHSCLPHTPVVRAQAALCIGQWQNNKAPQNKNAVGADHWIGMNTLMQYFKERFYSNGIVIPTKFSRIVLKKNEAEVVSETAPGEGAANPKPSEDNTYYYLDAFDEESGEKGQAIEQSESIDIEEDEEYRVRSAVIAAMSSIRAKDGQTPPVVLQFFETILEAEDTEMTGNVVHPDEEVMYDRSGKKSISRQKKEQVANLLHYDRHVASLSYVSSTLIADALLALCHINVCPALITDPATGKPVQSKASHPVSRLIEIALRWLEWELYRENIRYEIEAESQTGVGKSSQDTIAACAIIAVSNLAILRQSTTDPPSTDPSDSSTTKSGTAAKAASAVVSASSQAATSADVGVPAPTTGSGGTSTSPKSEYVNNTVDDDNGPSAAEVAQRAELRRREAKLDEVTTAQYYMDIFDKHPPRSDLTRAACAQAIACICCAADRFEKKSEPAIGLLTALEFLLARIVQPSTSPSLRQTLALLMMDACTGKICSMQRVGAIGGRNDIVHAASRFLGGPLGASHGGDNGSAILMSVGPGTYPAANAVNDGARRGLRLLARAGHPRETTGEGIVVRIARFATNLWRTINGEPIELPTTDSIITEGGISNNMFNGVCSHDGHLRCALLALWQWIWSNPRGCLAVLQVQTWKAHEGTQRYSDLGADKVMKITEEEKAAAAAEDASLEAINRMVDVEIDRQKWRGEMAVKAYEIHKANLSNKDHGIQDVAASEQGIGQPLPPIKRDSAFKQGGWIASAAQQRRALSLDGGTAVTKLRLTVKSNND